MRRAFPCEPTKLKRFGNPCSTSSSIAILANGGATLHGGAESMTECICVGKTCGCGAKNPAPAFEFQNGQLVKVNGMRPEYMDGYRLIALVRYLAEKHEQPGASK